MHGVLTHALTSPEFLEYERQFGDYLLEQRNKLEDSLKHEPIPLEDIPPPPFPIPGEEETYRPEFEPTSALQSEVVPSGSGNGFFSSFTNPLSSAYESTVDFTRCLFGLPRESALITLR